MPTIDVIQTGAIDSRNFFAPDTTPIATITGTDTAVRVTLVGGLTLAYMGAGLAFTGTTPTAGTITGVQVLRPDGSVLAEMNLTLAPWQFAQITGSGPFDSYLANGHRMMPSPAAFATASVPNWFEGGNQADELQGLFGADSLFGGGGDDVIRVPASYPQNKAPAGLTLDGGTGVDDLQITTSAEVDFSDVTIKNIEVLSLFNGSLRLSANQIGKGAIALNATIQIANANRPIIVEQIEGRAVVLSQFTIAFPSRTNMVIEGTAMDDVQYANQLSSDLLLGIDGNDRLYGGGGADSLFGGAGDDVLVAGDDLTVPTFPSNSPDELRGGDGKDRLYAGNGTALLYGEAGDDAINGGAAFATLFGGDGNDWLKGGSAVFAGFGGQFSSSRLDGGAGHDTLVSGAVGTWMIGGQGDDRYVVDHAGCRIDEVAGGGVDRIVTSVSFDLAATAEIERVTVSATTGVTITGSDTANIIAGNIGNDDLRGAAGNDTISGGAGADALTGGAGDDTVSGGAGADMFVFATGSGRDVINDFANGEDVISIADLTAVTDFADLLANHLRQVGAHVVLDAGGGDELIIRKTLLVNLDAADFLI